MKTSIEGFEKFLKNSYPFFNKKGSFICSKNYIALLKKGLYNINRSEAQLCNATIPDFYQWQYRILDLPAKNKKAKKSFEDQKVAIGAFMKYYKYIHGIIKITAKK